MRDVPRSTMRSALSEDGPDGQGSYGESGSGPGLLSSIGLNRFPAGERLPRMADIPHVGSKSELESEFTKVHGRMNWIEIARWMALAFVWPGVLGMGLQLAGVLGSDRSPEPDSLIILAAQILVSSIGLATIAWLFFALVRARQQRGHRFVLLSLVLALANVLTGLGILPVVLIGQYDVVALTGQDMKTYQLYLGTAATIGIS